MRVSRCVCGAREPRGERTRSKCPIYCGATRPRARDRRESHPPPWGDTDVFTAMSTTEAASATTLAHFSMDATLLEPCVR